MKTLYSITLAGLLLGLAVSCGPTSSSTETTQEAANTSMATPVAICGQDYNVPRGTTLLWEQSFASLVGETCLNPTDSLPLFSYWVPMTTFQAVLDQTSSPNFRIHFATQFPTPPPFQPATKYAPLQVIPQLVVSNVDEKCKDTKDSVLAIESNSVQTMMSMKDMHQFTQAWVKEIQTMATRNPAIPFIPIEYYTYDKKFVENNLKGYGYVRITFVAHSYSDIGGQADSFPVGSWLIDVVLQGVDGMKDSFMKFGNTDPIDFALPCPQACG